MSLIKSSMQHVFDSDGVAEGYLVYAKHSSWDTGKTGLVTHLTPDRMTIQYFPGIGNAVNYFSISANEAAQELWDIRWSKDLSEVWELTGEE